MITTIPDIAKIAGLIGDRARSTMLLCLMAGRPFTATELARAARVTKQTASAHLSRLTGAGLVTVERLGRHRHFRLANDDVAALIEQLMGVADRVGAARIDPGPHDPALRKARICYDHLAGELSVLIFDSLVLRGLLRARGRDLSLTEPGRAFLGRLGIGLAELEGRRRPLCLACLDWSERRHHLAGAVGAAILHRCRSLGWARPTRGSRTMSFSVPGERALRTWFPLPLAGSSTRPGQAPDMTRVLEAV